MTYRIGPFTVKRGQNDIGFAPIVERRQVDGYVTRIRPDLTYLDGRVPGVDVIHLHHGVWLNLSRQDATAPGVPERFFGTGEEKTHLRLPCRYHSPLRKSDDLLVNNMIHNLTPVPTRVYMVYEIEFVPVRSRTARGMRARATDMGGPAERQRVSGVRRAQGRRVGWHLHLPGRRRKPVRRRAATERVGGRSSGRPRLDCRSETLGSAVPPATGALQWTTPGGLDPGTYTPTSAESTRSCWARSGSSDSPAGATLRCP